MNEKGQILVESIVGITIGVVALTGVLSLLSGALGTNKEVGRRFTGAYLAGEGIEVVKGIINKNYARGQAWNQGLSDGAYEFEFDTVNPSGAKFSSDPSALSNRELFFDSSTGVYSYDSTDVDTAFTRTVQITNIDRGGGSSPDEMKVKAVVEWQERGGGFRSITLEDHFFDWRP